MLVEDFHKRLTECKCKRLSIALPCLDLAPRSPVLHAEWTGDQALLLYNSLNEQ